MIWLGGVVHGDFSKSIINQNDVTQVVAPKLFRTLLLSAFALLLYLPLSVILASLAAVYRDRTPDHAISLLTLIGLSIPEFVLGTILLIVFAVQNRFFPVLSVIETAKTPGDAIWDLTLPAVTLAIAMSVYAIRMLRDNLIEILDSEYVRTATLKGLPRWRSAATCAPQCTGARAECDRAESCLSDWRRRGRGACLFVPMALATCWWTLFSCATPH